MGFDWFRKVPERSEAFFDILGCSKVSWSILRQCHWFWVVLKASWTMWFVLTFLRVWVVLKGYESFWGILWCCRMCGAFWRVLMGSKWFWNRCLKILRRSLMFCSVFRPSNLLGVFQKGSVGLFDVLEFSGAFQWVLKGAITFWSVLQDSVIFDELWSILILSQGFRVVLKGFWIIRYVLWSCRIFW